jgi:hypothetical protein
LFVIDKERGEENGEKRKREGRMKREKGGLSFRCGRRS